MSFISLQFLLFFPLVTALYFGLPHKYRWILLLTASCLFYMAFVPAYILILALTILIDYGAGILIEDSTSKQRKKLLLTVAIISTCLVLFIFKYFNFFNANFALIFNWLDWEYPVKAMSIFLPIGLSFHTFQSLSYVIEVYRGHYKAEHHFGIYALYVMFYPQLVAGPIERPQNLLHQFFEKHNFNYQNAVEGLKLMVWGVFKKVVIADRLALVVNSVYAEPTEHAGLPLLIATVFFAIQIYVDFSAYSDIAIGAAQVMGFKLMKNFNSPYFSRSISEFWTRWHISLSTWFKDYVYIPLGGNRVGKIRWQLNLLIVFLISGLWHGANWTYVIWGALHGFYLIFAIWTKDIREKLALITKITRYPRIFEFWKISLTFILVCFAWIFFRAQSLTDALYISTHLFTGLGQIFQATSIMEILKFIDPAHGILSNLDTAIALSAAAFLFIVDFYQQNNDFRSKLARLPTGSRWFLYYGIVAAILFFGWFGENQFIYFQF